MVLLDILLDLGTRADVSGVLEQEIQHLYLLRINRSADGIVVGTASRTGSRF